MVKKKSHTYKRTNLTYNWITRGKLLNANHDFLGEGPGPEHLGDQAFAACLLRCQLTATEQHFVCLKGRRVDTDMKCEGKAGRRPNLKIHPITIQIEDGHLNVPALARTPCIPSRVAPKVHRSGP